MLESILLRLRLGLNRPMFAFALAGLAVMAISFLAGSNEIIIAASRTSGGAYILLLLYFVFVKKLEDISVA